MTRATIEVTHFRVKKRFWLTGLLINPILTYFTESHFVFVFQHFLNAGKRFWLTGLLIYNPILPYFTESDFVFFFSTFFKMRENVSG